MSPVTDKQAFPALGEHSKAYATMRDDALLPDDIQPAPMAREAAKSALVTGATGFLGRHAVQCLLRETALDLVCLVRETDGVSARQRVVDALADIGVVSQEDLSRIRVVSGDVTLRRFGLSEQQYRTLAHEVGRIYHCAAHVNWARNYRQLRTSNVFGSLEVIRFACSDRCKPLVFVSTIAVCFASEHEGCVTEESDLLEHIDRMPLGYAQSKCVAENLMRQACARGLPVTILRPSLISGDSRSGRANGDDLIAALIEGCARSGVCGDSEWLLDCVPVDFVAGVIARVSMPGTVSKSALSSAAKSAAKSAPRLGKPAVDNMPLVLHLVHDKACHWRDAIACLNGFGCPVKLVSIEVWVRIVFADREAGGTRLYGYRRFFKGFGGMPAPFETYLQKHQQRINSEFSYQRLNEMGLAIPALDQELLFKYLEFYDAEGLLPARQLATVVA